MEAAQIREHEVWCVECQTGHTPKIVDGVLKVECGWDDPVASGMAKDPTIVRPSVLRAREAELVSVTSRIYTAAEHQASVDATVKSALDKFVAQLQAAGVQVVGAGAVAPPGGGA